MRWDDYEHAPLPWWLVLGFLLAAMLVGGFEEARGDNPDTGDHHLGLHFWTTFGRGPRNVTESSSVGTELYSLDLDQETLLGASALVRLSNSATFRLGGYGVWQGEREIRDTGSIRTTPIGYLDTSAFRIELGLRFYVGKR